MNPRPSRGFSVYNNPDGMRAARTHFYFLIFIVSEMRFFAVSTDFTIT